MTLSPFNDSLPWIVPPGTLFHSFVRLQDDDDDLDLDDDDLNDEDDEDLDDDDLDDDDEDDDAAGWAAVHAMQILGRLPPHPDSIALCLEVLADPGADWLTEAAVRVMTPPSGASWPSGGACEAWSAPSCSCVI